jgi:uncharacterized protein (TIGR02145 family)/uncharacterized repeat protein (TIGR02543 family)
MSTKNAIAAIFACSLIPFLLVCSNSTSPFTPADATISIMLENSAYQRSTTAVSDSVDKPIRIGISAYLSQYFDSVAVAVTGSGGDTEKAVTFTKSTSWLDTNWISDTFATSGAKTVYAVAFIQGGLHCSASATITVLARPVQTYSVIYNGNGSTSGAVPADANSYQQGAAVTVKANIGGLARTGYAFVDWNTSPDGNGTSYLGGETFNMGAANVTLYAVWTQNPTYTVTYNGNGNSGGTVPSDANSYQQGASVTVQGNSGNLARTGYTFAGWNTTADGSGTSYAGSSTFNIGAANVTLYAVWTQNPTYTVSYNGNGNTGGTVPSDVNAYQQGAVVNVKANTGSLARTGYTFAGWNTTADGNGTAYAGGATFSMGSANVTLYAVWTQNPTYTVTYNGNNSTGGTVPVDANAYQQGAVVTVKANTGNLARTGYTFTGWNTLADGGGTLYAGNATFTIAAANVTLYATWTVAVYTVRFNSNGGSGVDSQNVTYNATATAPAAPAKSGFVFAGWYSDQALTSQFSFTTPIVAPITLYAKWTPVYTVTYNGNNNTGGTAPADTNKYQNGSTVTVLDNTGSLSRTGYTFAGWNTNAAGTGTDRTSGSTFTMGSGNVTLYAKWTALKYTVTFNAQGGSAVANQSIDYGDTAISPVNPTKTAYVFAKWYTDSTFKNAFSFSTPITSSVTLYAKWEIRDADGNVYTEVKIGNQVWMVENLKTTKYKDNLAIPLVTDSASWANLATPGYCWYSNDEATYKNPYGALYNWYSISTSKLAPSGWHVPSDTEWNVLISFLGGGTVAGGKLKEQGFIHWQSPNTGATNSSAFTGLPGGARYEQGSFSGIGTWGIWWTSTEYSSYTIHANYNSLGYENEFVDSYHIGKGEGHSVRCIRDY